MRESNSINAIKQIILEDLESAIMKIYLFKNIIIIVRKAKVLKSELPLQISKPSLVKHISIAIQKLQMIKPNV